MDSGSFEIGNEAGLLTDGIKGLRLPSSLLTYPLSPTPSLPSSSLSTASSLSSEDFLAAEDLLLAAGPSERLDSFLQEALNSRNRITVLRLEQEIEKFAANSKQQQLLLRHMLSSYERLAAHRVAQYYNLQSMAVDSKGTSGSRILLLKTPDSKVPSVRLVDIPVDSRQADNSASPPLGKVEIKQRTSKNFNINDVASAGRMRSPLKSVEQRTEEYNKARARIFSNGGDLANRNDSRVGAASSEEQHTVGELPLSREVVCIGAERDHHEDEAAFRAASRVAVFRDREKDIKDPDYDRSYGRYSPPLKTGNVATSSKPLVANGACFLSSSMLCQVGIGNLQTQADTVFYPAFDNQNRPWAALAGLPVLGYPCVSPGMCTQGQSLSNAYPVARKLVHPGYHRFPNWCQPPPRINPNQMSFTHVTD